MLAVSTGLVMSSMTAFAAPAAQYTMSGMIGVPDKDGKEQYYTVYDGGEDPRELENHGFEVGEAWTLDYNATGDVMFYIYNGDDNWIEVLMKVTDSYPDSSAASSNSSSTSKSKPRDIQAEARAIAQRLEAEAQQAEAESEGFADVAQMQAARAESKSAGEYYNNAVLHTPGIEEAMPVAQGGNLIVDGVETNMTATISKVDVAFVDSIRAMQNGTVLNVVNVQFPAKAAVINFYMPGVTDNANIAAMQYEDGTWVDAEVKEVKADHVVLNLKGNGVVAFIAK